jgi:hypothetical protein
MIRSATSFSFFKKTNKCRAIDQVRVRWIRLYPTTTTTTTTTSPPSGTPSERQRQIVMLLSASVAVATTAWLLQSGREQTKNEPLSSPDGAEEDSSRSGGLSSSVFVICGRSELLLEMIDILHACVGRSKSSQMFLKERIFTNV